MTSRRGRPVPVPLISVVRWCSALLGSVAIVALVLSRPAIAQPERTFATPEAAVTHFVTRVAADDLDGAMQAFAVDDYATHFDFAATAREMGSFMASFLDGPSRYRMYVRINALKAASESAGETMKFMSSLLLDDRTFDRLGRLGQSSEAEIEAVVQALDPAKLRSLTVVRIDQPLQSVTTTPKSIELARKQAMRSGADHSTDRIALFKLGGQHYWGGFHLLKYGKTWRIRRLMSYYAEVSGPPGRNVAKTTAQEYLKLTK